MLHKVTVDKGDQIHMNELALWVLYLRFQVQVAWCQQAKDPQSRSTTGQDVDRS